MKINSTNVTIMVKDMDKSINFYLALGFELKQRWENHYAMLAAPDLVIGLHPADEKIENGNQISIGLMIDDINDAKNLLSAEAIDYKYADGKSGIYCHFRDPDGTEIYFTQPGWDK